MKREKRKVPFEVVRPHLRRAAGQQMGLRMRWGGVSGKQRLLLHTDSSGNVKMFGEMPVKRRCQRKVY